MSRARKVAAVGLSLYAGAAIGGFFLVRFYQGHNGSSVETALPSELERRSIFDRLAASYDGEVDRSEWLMGVASQRRRLVERARGRVLEVAAGTGRNVSLYEAPPVRELTLVDWSAPMLAQAQAKFFADARVAQRLRGLARPPELLRADAQRLPFADGAFDVVVDTFGLCSVEDPVAALREMARVVAGDGEILLLEHGRSTWSIITDFMDNRLARHVHAYGCYWNRDIAELVERAGLVVVEAERSNFGTTYRLVCRKKPAE